MVPYVHSLPLVCVVCSFYIYICLFSLYLRGCTHEGGRESLIYIVRSFSSIFRFGEIGDLTFKMLNKRYRSSVLYDIQRGQEIRNCFIVEWSFTFIFEVQNVTSIIITLINNPLLYAYIGTDIYTKKIRHNLYAYNK